MKRATSGDSISKGMKRATSEQSINRAAGYVGSGDSSVSVSQSSHPKRQRKAEHDEDEWDNDSSSQASKPRALVRKDPTTLTEKEKQEYDRLASHFIVSDIGTPAPKPIPLRFMAQTRHVAWQWRTKNGSMQYQSLIGGGVNTPEDSLG